MTFNLKDYQRACREQDEMFGARDKHLYDLCHKYSDHDSYNAINAKLYIIGRTYATGIERKMKKKEGANEQQGFNIEKLTDYFYQNRNNLNKIWAKLKGLRAPLNENKLKIIIENHGKLVSLLQPVMRNQKGKSKKESPRSFASKYLHFHFPAVPIFDSWAESSLRGLYHWKDHFEIFSKPQNADEQYFRFILRFWWLYQDAKRQSNKVNVKYLDNYLLWVAKNI